MSETQHLPRAIYGSESTPIRIDDIEIPCYVLDNDLRVLSQRGMLRALGMSESGGTGGAQRIVQFASSKSLNTFIDKELLARINSPIKFVTDVGSIALGYDAEVLQSVIRGVAKAYLKGMLQKQQEHIGRRAELLDDAFSKVGLRALIDEATGYLSAKERARNDLQKYFDSLLLKDYAKWVKTFPDEFFEMFFRLKGWTWRGVTRQPQVMGHYINDFVYSRLAPGILEELKVRNPKLESGTRKSKHHSWLTPDLGHPKLKEHLYTVMAMGRASGYNWDTFVHLMDKALPKFGHTMQILFPESINDVEPQKLPASKFNKQIKGLLAVPPPRKEKE